MMRKHGMHHNPPMDGTACSPKDPVPERTLTVSEYDDEEIRNYMTGMLKTLAIIAFLHYKMNVVPPLVVQCISNSLSLFQVRHTTPCHTIRSLSLALSECTSC
jgi:hypothetical protein